ncbi:hypothetical protein J4211_02260 [Candidatus Woesearchaeota archaeon]|nr:hypothetical protein [Candidatus Woesearchaeota archaeon]
MAYDPYYAGTQYYSGGQIQSVLAFMQSWGVVDALLPFLLLFALVFAILQKVELFKNDQGTKPDKKMHGLIAFAIAALVVLPHITGGVYDARSDPINIINTFLPSAAILLMVILMVVLLTGIVHFPNLPVRLVTIAAAILLMLTMVFQAFPAFAPSWLIDDPNMQALVIVLLVFGLIIWFITREDTPPGAGTTPARLDARLKEWLGG